MMTERLSFLKPVLLSVLVFAVIGWSDPSLAIHGGSEREIEVGDVVPKVLKQTIQGDSISIPAEEGLTVILFWATWSPRSDQALELWQKFSKDYSDQPLTILTVNAERDELDSQELKVIQQYISENISDLPTILDDGLTLFNKYAVKALPTAFFMENTGRVLYRYPSFPSSAPLDLQEELEVTLGLRARQTEEDKSSRGKLDYQPKNNALLHYNMAVQLYKKGYEDKALSRLVVALEKDPDYPDPLRALEGIFFAGNRTPENEAELETFLTENDLGVLIDRIGEGEPITIKSSKKIDAMERMRKLMEQNAGSPAGSKQE